MMVCVYHMKLKLTDSCAHTGPSQILQQPDQSMLAPPEPYVAFSEAPDASQHGYAAPNHLQYAQNFQYGQVDGQAINVPAHPGAFPAPNDLQYPHGLQYGQVVQQAVNVPAPPGAPAAIVPAGGQAPQGNTGKMLKPTTSSKARSPNTATGTRAAAAAPAVARRAKWPIVQGTTNQVQCPGCSSQFIKGSMKKHITKNHRALHQEIYGVPAPDLISCPARNCSQKFAVHLDVKDHLLVAHGIEQGSEELSPEKVRRMPLITLNDKFLALARTQNAVKRRIFQLEYQIQGISREYRTMHGLNTDLWSESGKIEADGAAQAGMKDVLDKRPPPPSVKVSSQYVAELLIELRREAAQMGKLQDGTLGSFEEVAEDLEALLHEKQQ